MNWGLIFMVVMGIVLIVIIWTARKQAKELGLSNKNGKNR